MPDFDPNKVRVPQTGRMFTRPAIANPTMPTTFVSGVAWTTPWTSLGVFNDDGVEHSFSEDVEEVTSWQRGVVRIVVTGTELTLKLSALESSRNVVEKFYGSTFVQTPATGTATSARLEIKNSSVRPAESVGFEWEDPATSAVWRLLMPRAQVSEVESPTFNAQGAVQWGMTYRALGSDASYLAAWETNDPGVLAAMAP